MFKFKNNEMQLIKSVVQFFNMASEHLKFEEEILINSNRMISAPFVTSRMRIEIKEDFNKVIKQYGTYAGSVLILNRLFDALYDFLKYKYHKELLNEQFDEIKEEIISRFIKNERVTSYLKYCLYKDDLIQISEKESKNLNVAKAFGTHSRPLKKRFNLKPIENKMESIEAKLKQLEHVNKNIDEIYNKYEGVKLSKLTEYLADSSRFNPNKKSFKDIKFKRKDIMKSYYASMKSYSDSKSQIELPTEKELNKDVSNLLKHVKKEKDHNFNESFYTFNDTLLIITYCMINRTVPTNNYWLLLKHSQHVLSQFYLPEKLTKHTPSDKIIDILLTSNIDKNNINKDFSEVVELLSDFIPKHLIMMKDDCIRDLNKFSPEDYKYDSNLVFHFEINPSYYPLHQVFKDFYIYYFKGFNDLRTLTNYIRNLVKTKMFSSYTKNKHFDIFKFNDSLYNTIEGFKFKDIETANNINTPKSLHYSQQRNLSNSLESIRYIHSNSTFSLFDDINFLDIYQLKIISSRQK
ncbi:hypothetical protein SOO42_06560 [Staphylococcus aureus]